MLFVSYIKNKIINLRLHNVSIHIDFYMNFVKIYTVRTELKT